MKHINFRKILANALAVFFSTLLGIVTTKGLIKMDVTITEILIIAAFPSAIQAALAFCNEWKKAEEELEQTKLLSNNTMSSILGSIVDNFKKLKLKDFILFDDD